MTDTFFEIVFQHGCLVIISNLLDDSDCDDTDVDIDFGALEEEANGSDI